MLTGGGGDEGEEVEDEDEKGPHLKLAGARRGGIGEGRVYGGMLRAGMSFRECDNVSIIENARAIEMVVGLLYAG